jgi:hypothetical protein
VTLFASLRGEAATEEAEAIERGRIIGALPVLALETFSAIMNDAAFFCARQSIIFSIS